jgi:hypothetical protein
MPLVTHSHRCAAHVHRVMTMADGRLVDPSPEIDASAWSAGNRDGADTPTAVI